MASYGPPTVGGASSVSLMRSRKRSSTSHVSLAMPDESRANFCTADNTCWHNLKCTRLKCSGLEEKKHPYSKSKHKQEVLQLSGCYVVHHVQLNTPGQEKVVQVFQDGLDVEVGLFNDRLWYRVSWRHKGHYPVSVDVHTQLNRVSVQRERQAVTQHLHGPFHLRTTRTALALATKPVWDGPTILELEREKFGACLWVKRQENCAFLHNYIPKASVTIGEQWDQRSEKRSGKNRRQRGNWQDILSSYHSTQKPTGTTRTMQWKSVKTHTHTHKVCNKHWMTPTHIHKQQRN